MSNTQKPNATPGRGVYLLYDSSRTSDEPKYSTSQNCIIQINYKIIFIWLMHNNVAVTPLGTNWSYHTKEVEYNCKIGNKPCNFGLNGTSNSCVSNFSWLDWGLFYLQAAVHVLISYWSRDCIHSTATFAERFSHSATTSNSIFCYGNRT